MSNWIHRCGDRITFVPLEQVCPACKINQAVENLRHNGAEPKIEFKTKTSWFAFLVKKTKTVKKNKPYEHQEDYYDRQG